MYTAVVLDEKSQLKLEKLAEDIFESARAGTGAAGGTAAGLALGLAEHFGKIEPTEIHVGVLRAAPAATAARAQVRANRRPVAGTRR